MVKEKFDEICKPISLPVFFMHDIMTVDIIRYAKATDVALGKEEKMISGWIQRAHFIVIVFTLIVLSILCQIIIGVLYQKLLKETENMAVTENKLLKQCKLKFSNYFELNEGNINIPVYVDKFMPQLRFAGISLTAMVHLSGQLLLLSVFAAGVGACEGIISGKTLGELLPYYISSLFGLYVYFSVASLVDAKGKAQLLRINLIDYLENHLAKHLWLVREKEMQQFIQVKKAADIGTKADEEKADEKECEGEMEELEKLLREFLA